MPSTHAPPPDEGYVETGFDALQDGDRLVRTGTAMAALRHTVFRRVFIGAFLSNIGSWMQNVILGAMAYDLTHSPTFVGVLLFAQLGPLMLFSMVGGLLADLIDRRRLLITVSVAQGVLSVALAWIARVDDPSRVGLVGIVFLIGVGQAVFGPTYSALLPALVGREDLSGAISLNSAQMNGSRVVGPVIASAVYARTGASLVFLVNAGSYLLVIWSLLTVELPPPVLDPGGPQGFRRLAAGFDVAKRDVVIGRALVTVFLFSLLSLPFIGQLPVLADRNLGIGPRSEQYGYLYACFGTGALLGALSIGTVLAGRSQERITRVGLVLFAGCLAVFSLIRSPGPAYIVIGVLGLFYFAVITSLSTVLQERLDDRNRGRVMALWIMGFGGTVPIGNLIAGPLIEASSITAVVLGGAAIAVALAAYANLHDHARNPRGRPMQILTGDLASVTGGQLQGPDVTVAGASIDSRSIDRGQLFVPIVAERDGHDFIAAALAAGAGAYLTEHEPVGGTAILVGDTAAALRLAGAHARTLLTCPVVGITGSVGKTSVKDLLAATLGSSLRTTASERSFNNELGVPLTLLSAPLDAEAVVVEMGARGFGQIAALCEIARPTIGIVTRVSAAHTEAFGGLDDVARAKGELPAALPKHGTAILFTGDERVLAMRSGTGASVITFGEGGDVRATGVELDDELHPRFRLESPWGAADVRLTVRGVHQVDNALAAAAAALVCDLAPEQVADGLAAAVLSPWRMELATGTTGARVLNDAYNANPASVTAALQALAALPATRRTAVLGVMAELGAGSRKEHAAIGRLAKRLGIRVISVHAPQYGADVDVPDADAAMAELGPLGPEDAVLVKGSRVAGLERLAETLLAP